VTVFGFFRLRWKEIWTQIIMEKTWPSCKFCVLVFFSNIHARRYRFVQTLEQLSFDQIPFHCKVQNPLLIFFRIISVVCAEDTGQILITL
jgi:hypothetical protein